MDTLHKTNVRNSKLAPYDRLNTFVRRLIMAAGGDNLAELLNMRGA